MDQRLAGEPALVRLGIEAAALDATVSGLPGDVRADQIGVWRANIEQRLVAEGMDPAAARVEASIVKAMFTGLVVDLLATGERRRLTRALEAALTAVDIRVSTPSECRSSASAHPHSDGSNTRMDVEVDVLGSRGVAPVMRSAAFSASIITGA